MSHHEVYVGVGANLEPERNIRQALELLAAQVDIISISTFYRSDPVGRPEQPPFLNGVLGIRTPLSAPDLKSRVLRPIEERLGRVRTEDKYAARPIDLDILLFDSAIILGQGIQIPDPDIRKRVFIAAPLLELAPDLVLPDTGEPLAAVPCLLEKDRLEPLDSFTQELRARFCP